MPVVEIAGKHSPIDNRFLHNIFGKALEHGLLQMRLEVAGKIEIDIRPLNRAVIPGIFRAAVIVHSRPLLGFPLVSHIKLMPVMVVLLVEIAGPDGKTGVGLPVFIHSLGKTAVKVA